MCFFTLYGVNSKWNVVLIPWLLSVGYGKCMFQLLKQNKWYVKLHPKSLHIYSLRSFPDKLLEGSHMYRLRSHTSRESGVRRAVVWQPPEDFPRSGVCARLCTHYTGPGCVSCQSLVLIKALFETWIRYKYLLGKWPRWYPVSVRTGGKKRRAPVKSVLVIRLSLQATGMCTALRSLWEAHCRCSRNVFWNFEGRFDDYGKW